MTDTDAQNQISLVPLPPDQQQLFDKYTRHAKWGIRTAFGIASLYAALAGGLIYDSSRCAHEALSEEVVRAEEINENINYLHSQIGIVKSQKPFQLPYAHEAQASIDSVVDSYERPDYLPVLEKQLERLQAENAQLAQHPAVLNQKVAIDNIKDDVDYFLYLTIISTLIAYSAGFYGISQSRKAGTIKEQGQSYRSTT